MTVFSLQSKRPARTKGRWSAATYHSLPHVLHEAGTTMTVPLIGGTFYVDYEQVGQRHTAQCHVLSQGQLPDVDAAFQAIFAALDDRLLRTEIVGLRYRDLGSNFSFPVGTFLAGSVFGSNDNQNNLTALTQLNFVGRSPTTGRKARIGFFGFKAPNEFDLRLASTQDADVLTVSGILEGTENCFLAVDRTPVDWYPYANISVNAYYQRKRRQG